MIGQKFGQLSVLSFEGKGPYGHFLYRCLCDCGATKTCAGSAVRSGQVVSCGCHRTRQAAVLNRRHGASKTPAFRAWQAIKDRCRRAKSTAYDQYGGRGVMMCSGWLGSSDAFMDAMGPRPSADHSVDRIDNLGHYSCGKCDECAERGWPMNCRWATRAEQSRNRRTNIMITIDGETLCAQDWAVRNGLPIKAVHSRITKLRWDPVRAVTQPVKR